MVGATVSGTTVGCNVVVGIVVGLIRGEESAVVTSRVVGVLLLTSSALEGGLSAVTSCAVAELSVTLD